MEIVYKATSNYYFVQSIVLRVGLIAFILYLGSHYNDNPPVITIVGIIAFLFFFFIGNDEITVYSDKIVLSDTSLLGVIFNLKGKVYHINDIDRAYLPEVQKLKMEQLAIVLLIGFFSRHRSGRRLRRFYLELKSGETVMLESSLETEKINNVVNAINSITRY